MKRLITICAIVSLMLSLTCVSLAKTVPNVKPPPYAPGWWNNECIYYAYGWWEDDMAIGDKAAPPNTIDHWATNYLENTDFVATIPAPNGSAGNTLILDLGNTYQEKLKKELYIYITGTTESTEKDILSTLDTDGGVFTGNWGGSIGGGTWTYFVSGEIIPQPAYVQLTLTVPGLTGVTNIWAGENCIPEPATISLLGLGVLAFLRKRRS